MTHHPPGQPHIPVRPSIASQSPRDASVGTDSSETEIDDRGLTRAEIHAVRFAATKWLQRTRQRLRQEKFNAMQSPQSLSTPPSMSTPGQTPPASMRLAIVHPSSPLASRSASNLASQRRAVGGSAPRTAASRRTLTQSASPNGRRQQTRPAKPLVPEDSTSSDTE